MRRFERLISGVYCCVKSHRIVVTTSLCVVTTLTVLMGGNGHITP